MLCFVKMQCKEQNAIGKHAKPFGYLNWGEQLLWTQIGGSTLAGPGGEQRSAGSLVNYKGCLQRVGGTKVARRSRWWSKDLAARWAVAVGHE